MGSTITTLGANREFMEMKSMHLRYAALMAIMAILVWMTAIHLDHLWHIPKYSGFLIPLQLAGFFYNAIGAVVCLWRANSVNK